MQNGVLAHAHGFHGHGCRARRRRPASQHQPLVAERAKRAHLGRAGHEHRGHYEGVVYVPAGPVRHHHLHRALSHPPIFRSCQQPARSRNKSGAPLGSAIGRAACESDKLQARPRGPLPPPPPLGDLVGLANMADRPPFSPFATAHSIPSSDFRRQTSAVSRQNDRLGPLVGSACRPADSPVRTLTTPVPTRRATIRPADLPTPGRVEPSASRGIPN